MTMKQGQLDIFIGEGAKDAPPVRKSKRPSSRRKGGRRRREAKKAPMLVDAYKPDARRSPLVAREDSRKVGLEPQEIHQTTQDARRKTQDEVVPHIHTVSEITDNIKKLLERSYTDVWVSGEVTDFRNRTGRHLYFALKDDKSKLRTVIFGAEHRKFSFELADGMELICHGRLNVYAPRGEYSLVADYCEPKGIGALQLAFEQLKKRLDEEGLFDPSRKKPLPYLPRRIGVVTSPTGAAIRDIIHILARRNPSVDILLHPVKVQGDGAAAEVAAAIEFMDARGDLDVLIVGRGGGSMEDLWAFNEEVVARAIAAARIPVISAVGHEIDFTIADFVADVRAPTPSAAAEIAVPVRAELVNAIAERKQQLRRALARLLDDRKNALRGLVARIADPRRRLEDMMLRIDALSERLTNAINIALEMSDLALAKFMSNLDHLSPLNVLAKGYAVVEGPDGKAVKSAKLLKISDKLKLRFHRGGAHAKVTKIVDE